jgi:RNA polymerase sigma factor (sigma-70 family)
MSADLIARIRAKPLAPEPWAEWYRSVYGRLFYFALRHSNGNRDMASDLVQETFARFIAYRAIERVQDDRHALAFLLKTCRNVAVDRDARARDLVVVGMKDLENLPAEPPFLSDIEIEQILGNLEPAEQQILRWIQDGQSISEIAQNLGIAYSAAGGRIFRLTKRLKKSYVER